MRFLVKLATRNLWRNRRRTLLTVSGLALGIMWLILVDSLLGGLTEKGIQNIVDFETGEVQVHASGYFSDRESLPLDRALSPDQVLPTVTSVDGVTSAAPRLIFGARLAVGWEEFPVIAVAVDPGRDPQALRVMQHLEGRSPSLGAYEAVIGSSLSELLDLTVGDVITLTTRTRLEAMQALDLTIVGLARTPNPNVNANHVYMPLDVADAALAMEQGATEFVVRLEPGLREADGAERIRQAFRQAGVDAEVLTWRESAAEFVALSQTSAASDMLLVGAILVIAIVGVTNTVLLGALERTKEIGIMKAMGLKEREIVRLFLLEATGIGLIATSLGAALAAAVNLYLVEVGVDVSAILGEIDFGFPIGTTIIGSWNGAVFIWAAAAGVVACWGAAYLPARRAARLDPATTIRR